MCMGFPCGSVGKESTCSAGDLGSIPGLGRSPGEGKGYPLQYPGLEKSMDFRVHGVIKSWTRLSDFHFTSLLRSTGNSDPTGPWRPSIWLNTLAICLTTLSSQQPWTVWEAQQLHFLYPAIPQPPHLLPEDGKDLITDGSQPTLISPVLHSRLDLGFPPHSAPQTLPSASLGFEGVQV